jgi:hypothetical protein
MERGQVTIEMIFIFGLFMLLIFAISVPSVFQGERYVRDVQFISDAKFATERLATFASSISNPYEKKNVEIYIPGYISGNLSGTEAAMLMGTCIETSGSFLKTTVAIIRRDSNGTVIQSECYDFSKNLGAGTWKMYVNTGSGYQEGPIIETGGNRYSLAISWENITSNTVPDYVGLNDCDAAKALIGEWCS